MSIALTKFFAIAGMSVSNIGKCGRKLLPILIVTPLVACHQPHRQHPAHYSATPSYQPIHQSSHQSGYRPTQSTAAPARQATYQTANLSFGTVKQNLRIGISNQSEVVRVLGSPNNLTINSLGREIWIYDRIHSELDSDSHRDNAGVRLGIGGLGSSVLGAFGINVGESHNRSKMTSTTRTLTVILEFDQNQILRDMLVREGRY